MLFAEVIKPFTVLVEIQGETIEVHLGIGDQFPVLDVFDEYVTIQTYLHPKGAWGVKVPRQCVALQQIFLEEE